jgi:HSP20 family protein
MSNPYNPFRDMDRLFNQVGRAVSSDMRAMPMDLYRKGDTFVVKMDLPGVDPNTIDIDIDDRTLTVRAERTSENLDTKTEKNTWVSRERSFGTYARQISLGQGLDLTGVDADYNDGVLTLTIPVAEEAKPRKVAVRTGADAPSAQAIEGGSH